MCIAAHFLGQLWGLLPVEYVWKTSLVKHPGVQTTSTSSIESGEAATLLCIHTLLNHLTLSIRVGSHTLLRNPCWAPCILVTDNLIPIHHLGPSLQTSGAFIWLQIIQDHYILLIILLSSTINCEQDSDIWANPLRAQAQFQFWTGNPPFSSWKQWPQAWTC